MGGDQLSNAMRHMDIGDIRPRQVDDDEVQMPSQVVNLDSNEASTSGTQHEDQEQNQDQASNENQ